MTGLAHSTTFAKAAFLAVGWSAVVLGLVGVFVPGLPTTVFVLTASYCFSRSSPRFERWLRDHPLLGRSVRQFTTTGGMTSSAKRVALLSMWTAIALSAGVLMAVHWAIALGTVTLGLIGSAVIVLGVRGY